MKSIRRSIEKISSNVTELSSYMVFARAVNGKFYSREAILKNFNAMVDKDDYIKEEKKKIIDFLYELSNTPLGHRKNG